MDALKFLEEKHRMCNYEEYLCDPNCPLKKLSDKYHYTCSAVCEYYPNEAIAVVEKWSEEHPKNMVQNAFADEDATPKEKCPSFIRLKGLY